MHPLTETEAIERYDRAGAARAGARFAGVRWPDVAADEDNLARLVEGVLGARVDFAREAFGPDFESEGPEHRLEEAWRRDAVQVRYAPEGLFVRAAFTVRVRLSDDDGEEEALESVSVDAEICLSFSTRRHARPFVDFMRGRLLRASDGAARTIDPFAMMVEPQDAVAWGLNGVEV
ncbi:MAG: hypothetical protein IAE82_15735 [Opitutaceae bacterium]|nr:hypothetical protein [Opitutaceae bacterium]